MPQRLELTGKTIVCEYLYYKFGSSKLTRWIKLPLVELRMKSPTVEYGSIGLVDSGSDKTFVPKEEADLLGLKPLMKGSKPMTGEAVGAGGSFMCEIMILPEMRLMRHGVPFHSFHGLNVWVPQKTGDVPYSIIGRDSIFHGFEITFDEGRKRITFKRA